MGFQFQGGVPGGGLGWDLLNSGPPSGGLAAALTQGLQDPGVTPTPLSDDSEQGPAAQAATSPRLTDANVQLLGRVLTGECKGVCNQYETQGVGSTVINRMSRDVTDDVAGVVGNGSYAIAGKADPQMLVMARQLLTGQLPDNTSGATNFYSPRSMPMEGHATGDSDIGGGLELTPPLKVRHWSPSFANGPKKYPQNSVLHARDWVVKFYTQPGNGRVY